MNIEHCAVTYHGLLWSVLAGSGWITAYVCGNTAHMLREGGSHEK
jgi:hypothetical protein